MSEGKMEWWPVEKITTNPDGPYVQVLKDHWWVVNELGQVAMWRSSSGTLTPQCNTSPDIAIRQTGFGGVGICLLAVAFSPIRIQDYL